MLYIYNNLGYALRNKHIKSNIFAKKARNGLKYLWINQLPDLLSFP